MPDPKKKKLILIADDDASQRRLLEFWLQEAGYEVQTATDGGRALELFRERSPSVVVSDMRMPGIDGLELLRQIKAMDPDTPVILITAFGTVNNAVEAMKVGAADYILKPVNSDELKLSIERSLDHRELLQENRQLRELTGRIFRFENLVAASRKMRDLFDLAARVAERDSTVLITGESGTGKELVAKALHQNSPRRLRPFITINCGAIPENLIESELFGYRKGAFTGAIADRAGKFEAANGGTVFLDEIAELPLALQVRLLRVLQEREVDKLGEPHPVKVDVRIIAATNRALKTLVEDGQFRQDLFYRLSVIRLELPPLRERRDDIPPLVAHFLRNFADRYKIPGLRIEEPVVELLQHYDWPGNVRELENVIESLVVLAKGEVITAEDLPTHIRKAKPRVANVLLELPDEGISLEEVEKEILLQALDKNRWNRTRAARYLNITRKTLNYRVEKYGLAGPAGETLSDEPPDDPQEG